MLTLYSFKKTVLFSAQVEYSNFSSVFRLKIFFYYSKKKKREFLIIYTEYIKTGNARFHALFQLIH